MKKATVQKGNFEWTFTDADVINPDDFIAHGEYNPHNVRPFLLHNAGFVLAVVFADCLLDALNEAADNDVLDRFQVSEGELADYGEDEEGITRLGNASEPFDLGTLDAVELENPKWSFAALWEADK